jgi:hypothetical protein
MNFPDPNRFYPIDSVSISKNKVVSSTGAIIFLNDMSDEIVGQPRLDLYGWRRTFMLLILVAISLLGWLRMVESIYLYSYLLEIGLSIHPIYLILSGGLIGLLFLVSAIFIILRINHSIVLARIIALVWGGLYLFENLILSQSINFFTLLITTIIIGLIFLLTIPVYRK